MNEVKLKPCPFCGGEAEAFGVYGEYGVMCKECNAVIASADEIDDAVKAWNKRDGHNATYIERLNELFPEAITEDVVNTLCICQLFGEEHDPPNCEELSCADCWNREMP